MNYADSATGGLFSARGVLAAQAAPAARTAFIRQTYVHLGAAIYLFVALEWALFSLVPGPTMERIAATAVQGYNWLIVLGAFMLVGWIASSWAQSDTSRGMQYAGLILYVAAEAVIFLPLLALALRVGGISVVGTAGLITLVIFGGLTAAVFLTGKDFSFLRTGLTVAAFAALGLIACGVLFGFVLGTLFSILMIALAGGYVLYHTSNVMYHYRTDQYVAASLALFAAVALLFWYVLQLVLSSRD